MLDRISSEGVTFPSKVLPSPPYPLGELAIIPLLVKSTILKRVSNQKPALDESSFYSKSFPEQLFQSFGKFSPGFVSPLPAVFVVPTSEVFPQPKTKRKGQNFPTSITPKYHHIIVQIF